MNGPDLTRCPLPLVAESLRLQQRFRNLSRRGRGTGICMEKASDQIRLGIFGHFKRAERPLPRCGVYKSGRRRGASGLHVRSRYGARGWIGRLSYSSTQISRAICSVSYAACNAGLRFRR